MKTIVLYGDLRKTFGKEFKLNVVNAAQAVSALCKLVGGFQEYLVKHSSQGFFVKSGKDYLDKKELANPNSDKIIRIGNNIVGAKGAFKIILGVALIALSFAVPVPGLLEFGVSTLLSGIAEALFSPPTPASSASREESKPSYSFDGPVNTTQQGNPVPLAYGEILVGSQVVSAVIIAKDI